MAVSRSVAYLCGLALLAGVAHSISLQVTPVEKVIELLKSLEVQIEEEGKTEAADYDKFACFCKEQADGKLYAIEKSTKKIEKLQAEIAELESQIAGLEDQIQ